MQSSTQLKLYTLEYNNLKTYLVASLFIIGNIVLPQMVHLIPQGGLTWLPIYFFTLVGAYKYGWKAGLITAIASPLINSFFFDMPPVQMLPAIMIKSTLLAIFAGLAARRFKKASLWLLAIVVVSYQAVGTLGEWALTGSLDAALQDMKTGVPGMLLQVIGGWIILNYLLRE